MQISKFGLVVIFILSSLVATAQDGFIRGVVYDDNTGESLVGVTVLIEGTSNGAITDLDGSFNITVPAGIYNLKVSYVSYQPITISEIKVIANEVALFENIRLTTALTELAELVITAERTRDNEAALLTIKMKSPNVIDGVSSGNFAKIGDSDAAGAMKRVTGVSVTSGKYIYVRGLGDRYTKTTLNGMDIPGLDPDRNTLQMDIFPTNLLDNILVYKSFSAELPADFTGGIIDIELKDFPSAKTASIGLNAGFNPDFHFNENYLTYEGGATDWLGFDDGTREIPAEENIPLFSNVVGDPDGPEADRYKEILGNFNPTMAAFQERSNMDYGFSASYGNQNTLQKGTIGYNFALSYKNTTEFYENAEYGRYGLPANPDEFEMEVREFQLGDFGVNTVFVSGMAGVAFKTTQSKYRLNLLHLQNGETKAGIFDFINSDQGAEFFGFQHNLDYSQRSLTNLLIAGSHRKTESKWNFTWKISPTYSTMHDPDIRFTRYQERNDAFVISTESGFPERIWRELNEINIGTQGNVVRDLNMFANKATLKFGSAYTFKSRYYDIKSFALNIRNLTLTGDPDELFLPENLWPYNGNVNSGTTYEVSFIPNNPNHYNANVNNIAAYGSLEFIPIKKMTTILGLRTEKYTQRYTGQDQLGTNVLDNDIVLDELNLFPTLNVIYAIQERQNLRFSYSKTIARPSFKELSYAEIYDPITGRVFIGGLFRDANDVSGVVYWDGNLQSTDIHNFDMRWEVYLKNDQLISAGVFYKQFYEVIEIVQFATQTGAFQPRNVGDGRIAGAEFELRKNLEFVAQKLKNFNISTNVTLVDSKIKLSATEYESRVDNARTGQVIDTYRQMAGQSPYIINAGVAYSDKTDGKLRGLEAGLYYNVQGTTLLYVGIADRPDIYTLPFHSLNFNASVYADEAEKFQIGFKVDNILNDRNESVFQSFNAEDQYFTNLLQGRTFSLKLAYNFF